MVVLGEGVIDISYGQLQGGQQFGVNGYLVLLEITAKTVDFHNALYSRQLAFDNPVLDSTQFHGIILVLVLFIYFQYILVDFTQTGGYRHHLWCAQFGRYLSSYCLYLLIDELTGFQGRNTLFEYHGNQ